jgi:hypothetical protein
MSHLTLRRIVAPAVLVVGLAALALASSGMASAQEGESNLLFRVIAPAEPTDEGTEVPVEIRAENAQNFAAFGFQLTYDPDVLEIAVDDAGQPLIQRGDFLGQSGREVVCREPVVQAGVLRMSCNTLRMEPAGVDGDGTLATVTFLAKGAGTTDLALDRLEANEPDATEIRPIDVQGAAMEVQGDSGMNWLIWGPVIAIGAIAVIAIIAFVATRVRGKPKSAPAATT